MSPPAIHRYPFPLFALVATSGAGKTTLEQRLATEMKLPRIIACTTRAFREGDASDAYHFLSEQEFTQGVEAGEFAEHVTLFDGKRYGRRWVELDCLNRGPAYADMTEHGVRDLRAAGVWIICIRIEAKNQAPLARVDERATIDEARKSIAIDVEATVINDHGIPNGLEHAYHDLERIILSALKKDPQTVEGNDYIQPQ